MNSRILHLREWLLNQRWWLVGLVSLSVFIFEFLEHMPFRRGVWPGFIFELAYYGIILPLATGLALSALAASRSELAWSTYYQSLKVNLDLQILSAHSYVELAEIFLQFTRVVLPVVGAVVYSHDRSSHSSKSLLIWSLSRDSGVLDSFLECGAAESCHLLAAEAKEDGMPFQPCGDPQVLAATESSSCFCMPFVLADSRLGGARLYFRRESLPSPEQVRLLREAAPRFASGFRRIELESQVKKRDESISIEQQRIARDVHDSLGHSLAYLRLRLDQISMELDQTRAKTLRSDVESLRDVAKEAYDQMRDVLVALAPESNSDLSNALLHYLEIIGPRSNYKLNVINQGQPRMFPPDVQRHIFFIFREALTNVQKHAQAREVGIALCWQDSGLEISINDDGAGFEPRLAIQNGHFGLKNMRDRALEINGRLAVSSQPGRGTRFLLSVPYPDEP